eukprot:m.251106 g.251106  ORF g.251106 m.251106 type:complete len:415 (+) comp19105_c0_seq4:151-1395(+)
MALFGSLAATVARPAFAVACRGGVRAVRPSAGTGAPASWGQRWLSERPSKAKRRPETTQRQNNERRFVDCVRVFVRGGTGGQGSRRLCMAGGDGGDVVARATLGCHDLNEVADLKRLKADAGASAQRSHKPKPAQPLRIPVPVGTVITTDSGEMVADLDYPGQEALIASGGQGGSIVTSDDSRGEKGQALHLTFEVKSIADVGLVGCPNAGKSSLLRAVSKARPKVADYPFTTLRPQVATVRWRDMYELRMADIPGLIEGAHANRGMGHSFLRHVERCRVLLFVLDVHGFQLSADSARLSAFETLQLLVKELRYFERTLGSRPCVIAANKMDLDPPLARQRLDELKADLAAARSKGRVYAAPVVPISAMRGLNIAGLASRLRTAATIGDQDQDQNGTLHSNEGFREFLRRPVKP